MAGFFERIRRFFRGDTQATTTPSRGGVGGGGVAVYWPGGDAGLSVATVYRCVALLSDSVARMRLRYMRMKEGRYQEDTASDFHYLLSIQPQPEMSAYDFWCMTVRQMLMDGNAYIYPRRIGNEVTDLVLCHRGSVGHNPLNNTYTISDAYNGVYGTFDESEIIHLYLYSSDGRCGESVLTHAARTMAIASAGDDETLNRFRNGGNVRGIVSNDKSTVGFGEYQDKELEKTAENIDSRFQNGEKIVSLPGQVGFQQISLSSTDMQFLESRKFTVRDICRFFGVHPSFVYDDSATNYKSAEMANVAFLSNTLDPILCRIECEFQRKLVSRKLCHRAVFKFDRTGIYSLDLASRAAYQKATIESGIYTINDWRRIENQPEVEGGDTVYVSTNMAALGSDKLAKGAEN